MAGERSIPVVCTLGEGDLSERVAQWEALLAQAVRREIVPGGAEVAFPRATDIVGLVELVEAEQRCCAWMTFRVTVSAAEISLGVSGPDEGRELIETVFGSAS